MIITPKGNKTLLQGKRGGVSGRWGAVEIYSAIKVGGRGRSQSHDESHQGEWVGPGWRAEPPETLSNRGAELQYPHPSPGKP